MSGTGVTLLLAAIGVAALLSGRLFVGAFGGALYRRLDPAGAVAGLAVGTVVLTQLSVTSSGVGFPTRDLPLLVAVLHLPVLAVCVRRRRLDVLLARGTLLAWSTLAVPVALTAALALLPVTRGGGYSFGNDTYTYSAFAEWLQTHGFSEECRWEAQSPVTGIPALWQSQGYDLGIAHWLALVQAAVRPATVLVVYPSTSAFGLCLLTATLWLAARQLLRLGTLAAGATALAFAAIPHALYWGHHNGFLQQGYALPMVVFGLVLVARAQPPARWRPSTALLLALPVAFLVSVYLPLAPLLAFGVAVGFLPALARARRRGEARELLLFAGAAGLAVFAFAGRDVVGALSPLHRFATSVAGGHIPWGAADFARFALGTRVLAAGWTNVEVAPWSEINGWLTPAYGSLAAAGLLLAARRPRTRPLGAAAALLLVAASYYALAAKDPWSGTTGHTWNLFKLAQWIWPFVLLLGALAVRNASALAGRARPVAVALALALPASQIGVHAPWSERLAQMMRDVLPGLRFAELEGLKQRIQDLPSGTLLVVGRPASSHWWLSITAAILAYPRAIVGDWSDSASLSNHPTGGQEIYDRLLERWREPFVVPLLVGFLPFEAGKVEDLGGGFARVLPGRAPLIVRVVNPAGVDAASLSALRFTVGTGRTKIVVFSPVAGSARLTMSLAPYAGRPGTKLVAFLAGGDANRRNVRGAWEGVPVASVPLAGATDLEIPLRLPEGLATVVLLVDEGRGELNARAKTTVRRVSLGPA